MSTLTLGSPYEAELAPLAAGLLRRALEIVERPEAFRPHDRFGSGSAAWDADGVPCLIWDQDAVVFTGPGALARARLEMGYESVRDIEGRKSRQVTELGNLVDRVAWDALAWAAGVQPRRLLGALDGMPRWRFVALLEKAARRLESVVPVVPGVAAGGGKG